MPTLVSGVPDYAPSRDWNKYLKKTHIHCGHTEKQTSRQAGINFVSCNFVIHRIFQTQYHNDKLQGRYNRPDYKKYRIIIRKLTWCEVEFISD